MKCQLAAPAVFEVGEDDLSHVLQDDVPQDQVTAVERAIRVCPKQAISWVGEGWTERLEYPGAHAARTVDEGQTPRRIQPKLAVMLTPTSIPQAIGIVSIDQLGRQDAWRAGSKAANLGELARAGFPVPPGVVLLPGTGDAAVDAVAALFGDVPLAVRSSGVAEDLADASFAGQYETVLGVRGLEQLGQAVRRCRESVSSARVVGYRSARAEQAAGDGMAVLIQRLVRADAGGVVFTANPVTGARDEMLVSAVRGLGERLVSAQADPDEWVVKGDRAECGRTPEGALDEAQVRSIADMARRVEAHFGRPQDIEWAIEDGVFWLLQARPITALPEPIEPVAVPVAPPPGLGARSQPCSRTLDAARPFRALLPAQRRAQAHV
jgi:ferredoxin